MYAVELAQNYNGRFSGWLPAVEFKTREAAWSFIVKQFGSAEYAREVQNDQWMAYKA
jgi:hypothetical protein